DRAPRARPGGRSDQGGRRPRRRELRRHEAVAQGRRRRWRHRDLEGRTVARLPVRADRAPRWTRGTVRRVGGCTHAGPRRRTHRVVATDLQLRRSEVSAADHGVRAVVVSPAVWLTTPAPSTTISVVRPGSLVIADTRCPSRSGLRSIAEVVTAIAMAGK